MIGEEALVVNRWVADPLVTAEAGWLQNGSRVTASAVNSQPNRRITVRHPGRAEKFRVVHARNGRLRLPLAIPLQLLGRKDILFIAPVVLLGHIQILLAKPVVLQDPVDQRHVELGRMPGPSSVVSITSPVDV